MSDNPSTSAEVQDVSPIKRNPNGKVSVYNKKNVQLTNSVQNIHKIMNYDFFFSLLVAVKNR